MGACKTYRGDFLGWNGIFLENELVKLVAVPDVGGRLMQYNLGQHPFLWVDKDLAGKLFSAEENQGDGSVAAWKNYGGDKTWPSPQGWATDEQWHGPPDPILDTGIYTAGFNEGTGDTAEITMISPTGSPTGIQISRKVVLEGNSTRVKLGLSFHNLGDKTRKWSIWDVVQLQSEKHDETGQLVLDPAGVVSTPVNPNSQHEKGYWVMFGKEDNPQWQVDQERGVFLGKYIWEIGKVGLDSQAGWAGFSNTQKGYGFAARFPIQVGEEYPDNGSTVEFWTVGRGQVANLDYEQTQIYLMEVEVLSPLYTIQPGETVSFDIEWGAAKCCGPIIDVTEAGLIARRLTVTQQNGKAKLSGCFGVFDVGEMVLQYSDAQGIISEELMGTVSPLSEINLEKDIDFPTGTTSISLAVRTEKRIYQLASASM